MAGLSMQLDYGSRRLGSYAIKRSLVCYDNNRPVKYFKRRNSERVGAYIAINWNWKVKSKSQQSNIMLTCCISCTLHPPNSSLHGYCLVWFYCVQHSDIRDNSLSHLMAYSWLFYNICMEARSQISLFTVWQRNDSFHFCPFLTLPRRTRGRTRLFSI